MSLKDLFIFTGTNGRFESNTEVVVRLDESNFFDNGTRHISTYNGCAWQSVCRGQAA